MTTGDLPDDFTRARQRLADTPAAGGLRSAAVELKRETIIEEIVKQGHNMSKVARRLGISRSTLYRKLTQHGIARD